MANSMQIKSNIEVRDFKEEVYFGMTLRQLLFTGLAGAAALGVYFLCHRRMSMEMVSWLCVAAAVPFGAFGFVHWHGLPFEQILLVLIRSRTVLGRPVFFRPENPLRSIITNTNRRGKCHDTNRKEDKNPAPGEKLL